MACVTSSKNGLGSSITCGDFVLSLRAPQDTTFPELAGSCKATSRWAGPVGQGSRHAS